MNIFIFYFKMIKTKFLINMRKIFFPASYVSGNREKIIIHEEKQRIWQKVFWIEPLMSTLIFWEMRPCNYTSSGKKKKKGPKIVLYIFLITTFLLKRKLSHVFDFMFFILWGENFTLLYILTEFSCPSMLNYSCLSW